METADQAQIRRENDAKKKKHKGLRNHQIKHKLGDKPGGKMMPKGDQNKELWNEHFHFSTRIWKKMGL
jgi:hypothetical protein